MMWPDSLAVYGTRHFLTRAQSTIVLIANTISEFEPVILLAHPDRHTAIRRQVGTGVDLWDIPTEDLWARDAGPLFARHPDKGLVISHIRFNGWGGPNSATATTARSPPAWPTAWVCR